MSYSEAYNSVDAVCFHEYFSHNDKWGHEELTCINQLGDIITAYKGSDAEFIDSIFAKETDCNWERVIKYLKTTEYTEGNKSDIYILLKIMAVLYTYFKINGAIYPSLSKRIGENALRNEIYIAFQRTNYFNQFNKILNFDSEVYFHTWRLIYGHSITEEPYKFKSSIVSKVDEHKQNNMTENEILGMYYVSRTIHKATKNEISNYYQYCRKYYLEDAYERKSPGYDFYAN